MAKTKLELTWIGKGTRPKLEPRILLEDAAKSYHAASRFNRRRFTRGSCATIGSNRSTTRLAT